MSESSSAILIFVVAAVTAGAVLCCEPELLKSEAGFVMIVLLAGSIVGLVMDSIQLRGQMPERVNHPRCGRCGYNMTGHVSQNLPEVICPECGQRIAEVGIVEPGDVNSLFIRKTQLRRMAKAGGLFAGLSGAATLALLGLGILDWRALLLAYGMCVLGVSAGVQYVRSRKRERYTGSPCPHCGYRTAGNTSGLCPECGERPATQPNTDRRSSDAV